MPTKTNVLVTGKKLAARLSTQKRELSRLRSRVWWIERLIGRQSKSRQCSQCVSGFWMVADEDISPGDGVCTGLGSARMQLLKLQAPQAISGAFIPSTSEPMRPGDEFCFDPANAEPVAVANPFCEPIYQGSGFYAVQYGEAHCTPFVAAYPPVSFYTSEAPSNISAGATASFEIETPGGTRFKVAEALCDLSAGDKVNLHMDANCKWTASGCASSSGGTSGGGGGCCCKANCATLTINGMVNGDCGQCECLNGVPIKVPLGNSCEWSTTLNCGECFMGVQVKATVNNCGDVVVTVGDVEFTGQFMMSTDMCLTETVNLTLGDVTETNGCDFALATATLTFANDSTCETDCDAANCGCPVADSECAVVRISGFTDADPLVCSDCECVTAQPLTIAMAGSNCSFTGSVTCSDWCYATIAGSVDVTDDGQVTASFLRFGTFRGQLAGGATTVSLTRIAPASQPGGPPCDIDDLEVEVEFLPAGSDCTSPDCQGGCCCLGTNWTLDVLVENLGIVHTYPIGGDPNCPGCGTPSSGSFAVQFSGLIELSDDGTQQHGIRADGTEGIIELDPNTSVCGGQTIGPPESFARLHIDTFPGATEFPNVVAGCDKGSSADAGFMIFRLITGDNGTGDSFQTLIDTRFLTQESGFVALDPNKCNQWTQAVFTGTTDIYRQQPGQDVPCMRINVRVTCTLTIN